ncbi:hypothetical protein E2562_007480 [Oryza meyeriana var. granulata]|uniref:Uncharacterized protein n=1 Tax=Oryza meyeriana var. granulata TaxID=110450 RepID=A0A6G1F502_9ORYZ|nr:hypothetical protein E2562_007480 [Oryza meyeriana var. granulata]
MLPPSEVAATAALTRADVAGWPLPSSCATANEHPTHRQSPSSLSRLESHRSGDCPSPPLVVVPPPCSSSARVATQPATACARPSHAATSTTLGRLSVTPERRGSTLPRSSRSLAPPHRHLSLPAAPPAATSAAPCPGCRGP